MSRDGSRRDVCSLTSSAKQRFGRLGRKEELEDLPLTDELRVMIVRSE